LAEVENSLDRRNASGDAGKGLRRPWRTIYRFFDVSFAYSRSLFMFNLENMS